MLIENLMIRKAEDSQSALKRTSFWRNNPPYRFYKYCIIDSVIIVKDRGLKALFKERGIKVFAAVFCYYLIRDTILYIIIPLLIAKGLF